VHRDEVSALGDNLDDSMPQESCTDYGYLSGLGGSQAPSFIRYGLTRRSGEEAIPDVGAVHVRDLRG
jgi:hypothetical protein